jgi:hypothetical protein
LACFGVSDFEKVTDVATVKFDPGPHSRPHRCRVAPPTAARRAFGCPFAVHWSGAPDGVPLRARVAAASSDCETRGTFYGFVDNTIAAATSTTDVTTAGPYTWRN